MLEIFLRVWSNKIASAGPVVVFQNVCAGAGVIAKLESGLFSVLIVLVTHDEHMGQSSCARDP